MRARPGAQLGLRSERSCARAIRALCLAPRRLLVRSRGRREVRCRLRGSPLRHMQVTCLQRSTSALDRQDFGKQWNRRSSAAARAAARVTNVTTQAAGRRHCPRWKHHHQKGGATMFRLTTSGGGGAGGGIGSGRGLAGGLTAASLGALTFLCAGCGAGGAVSREASAGANRTSPLLSVPRAVTTAEPPTPQSTQAAVRTPPKSSPVPSTSVSAPGLLPSAARARSSEGRVTSTHTTETEATTQSRSSGETSPAQGTGAQATTRTTTTTTATTPTTTTRPEMQPTHTETVATTEAPAAPVPHATPGSG